MKINKSFIILVSLLIILIASFFIFNQRKANELANNDLAEYQSVYNEPSVRFLRQALNAFVEDKSPEACILQAAVTKSSGKDYGMEGITSGLEAFDKSYYMSKFVVGSISDNSENGKDIQIVFRDKPDRIFYAWIGKTPYTDLCLLGFNSKDMDATSTKKFLESLKPSIYDTNYGI